MNECGENERMNEEANEQMNECVAGVTDGLVSGAPYSEPCYRLIGAAMDVHNRLGPGHREVVYQRALMARLGDRGIAVVAEQPVEIYFADRQVGLLYMDCLVEDAVVAEKKRDGWRDRIERYLWRPPETRQWLEGQGNE